MAYAANNLAMLAYDGGGGSGRRYRYITTDSIATILAADYFDDAVAILDIGDIIDVTVVDAVALSSRTSVTGSVRLIVTANDGTDVTVKISDSQVVAVTASTLTLSIAAHHNKTVTLDRAAGIAVTLPDAIGSGARFTLVLITTVTSNSTTVKVPDANNTMTGTALLAQDAADTAVMFETAATTDTITFNGSTTGGIKGDSVELIDIAADLWWVRVMGSATGTEATPFSATVS